MEEDDEEELPPPLSAMSLVLWEVIVLRYGPIARAHKMCTKSNEGWQQIYCAAVLSALLLGLWALLMDYNYAVSHRDTAKEDWIGGRATFKKSQ